MPSSHLTIPRASTSPDRHYVLAGIPEDPSIQEETQTFDGVTICAGYQNFPHLPTFEGWWFDGDTQYSLMSPNTRLCRDSNLEPQCGGCVFPGQSTFMGQIIHSSAVRDMEAFQGKRVAIIGGGESASDICNEISFRAESTCIIVRNHHGHLINREQSNGLPTDMNTNR